VCLYAARRRREGAPWAVIARETGVDLGLDLDKKERVGEYV